MSTRPVGKCVNFRACSKADSREEIPVVARDANPVCPSCGQPLLVSTPVVNPRRNALIAIAIVALLVVAGLGFALRHVFTGGSNATVAVPGSASTSSATSADVAAASATPAPVATASPEPASAASASSASASAAPAAATTSTPAARAVSPAAVASAKPQSIAKAVIGASAGAAVVPADAASAYGNLLHTADKLDFALNFRRGSGLLDTKARADLSRLVSLLKSGAYRTRKVFIAGFADNTGDPGYSKFLSGQRAQTVAAELTAQDVPVAQTFGFGQIAPVGDNATREGREKNRRVEVFVAR